MVPFMKKQNKENPAKEIPKEELWLFDPKNKAIVDELKKALKQKAVHKINLDTL